MRLRTEFFIRIQNAPNIKVVDIQADDSIITNLEYYKDVGHFDDRVNHIILDQIAEQRFVSAQTLESASKKLRVWFVL